MARPPRPRWTPRAAPWGRTPRGTGPCSGSTTSWPSSSRSGRHHPGLPSLPGLPPSLALLILCTVARALEGGGACCRSLGEQAPGRSISAPLVPPVAGAVRVQSAVVQKQGWPVSWGWCASLRSFLFVYHRHNRYAPGPPRPQGGSGPHRGRFRNACSPGAASGAPLECMYASCSWVGCEE